MGTRGPAPKRADKRLGHIAKAEKAVERAVVGGDPPKPPPAKATWHPAAKRWYQSLAKSGQSSFYEPADWESAWVLAESMSRELAPKNIAKPGEEPVMVELPPRPAALAAWRQMMAALLVTEGDRRRQRLELVRAAGPDDDADVSELADYRRRLQSG